MTLLYSQQDKMDRPRALALIVVDFAMLTFEVTTEVHSIYFRITIFSFLQDIWHCVGFGRCYLSTLIGIGKRESR